MKKVTQGDKKKMVWLDMQHIPQGKIAQRIGISQGRVSHYIRMMKDSGEYADLKRELQGSEPVSFDDERPAPEPEPKPPKLKNTGVNPDFEQAVDEMIADAEPAPANAEPEGLPKYIWAALDDRISSINLEIETREQRIGELRDEIAELVAEREQIREWMEAHE